MSPREPKIQRWTDLIAALLRRHYTATFEDLSRDVPGYGGDKKKDAVMRMFERDKDELRSFGIAIDTVQFEDDDGEASGYRIDRKGFYLPYLSLAAREGRGASKPRKLDQYGYRALASLIVEPDELAIIMEAGVRARALGDPIVGEDVESALRKLSFDLPVADVGEGADGSVAFMTPMADGGDAFEVLNDALRRFKRVQFDYHSMGADRITRRDVEPYGLFFLSSHWYLAGRDAENGEMRNFRLNRIKSVDLNPSKSQTADYVIPGGFDLREHARWRQPTDYRIWRNCGRRCAIIERSASPTEAAERLNQPGG